MLMLLMSLSLRIAFAMCRKPSCSQSRAKTYLHVSLWVWPCAALIMWIYVCGELRAGVRKSPSRLTTDMLESIPAPLYGQAGYVCSSRPALGWELPKGTMQMAYRILVATSMDRLREGRADVWDSGRRMSDQSVGVLYGGPSLKAGHRYWWTVKVWYGKGKDDSKERASRYAQPREIVTATTQDSCFSHYPLMKTRQSPVSVLRRQAQSDLYDFGTDAFAQLLLRVQTHNPADTLRIHIGEAVREGHVDHRPQGTVRHATYDIPLQVGIHDYPVNLRPDGRNTALGANESGVDPILMPASIGEVTPFRYVEVEHGARVKAVWRDAVHEPFDDAESHFECSDTVLNQVWNLCKYSIKATSFAGIYVDGDRERIPYEADALVNQLSHYVTDREYTMARRSIAHLIMHPTWPTEWILLTPRMAWLDYLYTGDRRMLEHYYQDLVAKTFHALRDERGLISTRTGLLTREVCASVHFRGRGLRDIVDWPQGGAAGIEKESEGEADGHEMRDVNTVVNAYHYDALRMMSKIAGALGNEEDSLRFCQMAERTAQSINSLLWDQKRGAYVDGEGSSHCSQHSSMFPLAFGLVPQDRIQRTAEYVQSRGMACSVYGAQFLLDALYEAQQDEAALQLMAGTGLRSWYNMISMGSTITTEAWDKVFKPNLDWNHAWGAAAANLIGRRLMGITPLKPGFEEIDIQPQPGGLEYAYIKHPSPRGSIHLKMKRQPDGRYHLDLYIPANSRARLTLPTTKQTLTLLPGRHYVKE